ncbi:MAG: FAD-binding oxidoreductase, partial [Caldilineae bacterium]
ALHLIRQLVEEEGIACDFHPHGDLCVAFKPSHFEGFRERAAWHKKHLGHALQLIPPADLRQAIGSDAYFGGVVDPHGASLHPAKLVFGLAEVAARYGAQLCPRTPATRITREGGGFAVHTPRGRLRAREVIVATNGYTGHTLPGLRSRVIPVGSYSIVTEPLSPALQAEISPRRYVFWDSKWFLNYFRLTPDGRLLWGGRNNLSTNLDLRKSADILRAQMVRAFPQLAGVAVTHSWSGRLGLTFDLMPHIGRIEGVHYVLGFGGHGLHMALYLGREVAQLLTGEKTGTPFAEIPHPTRFFYRNRPWFMPLVVWYYRFRDWRS